MTQLERLKSKKCEITEEICRIDAQITAIAKHGGYYSTYPTPYPTIIELKAKRQNLYESLSQINHNITTCCRY